MKLYQQKPPDNSSSSFESVLKSALELSVEERAMLVDRLLQSLDTHNQAEIDKAWAEEIERRIREIDEGKVDLIPGEQVLAELRSRFKS